MDLKDGGQCCIPANQRCHPARPRLLIPIMGPVRPDPSGPTGGRHHLRVTDSGDERGLGCPRGSGQSPGQRVVAPSSPPTRFSWSRLLPAHRLDRELPPALQSVMSVGWRVFTPQELTGATNQASFPLENGTDQSILLSSRRSFLPANPHTPPLVLNFIGYETTGMFYLSHQVAAIFRALGLTGGSQTPHNVGHGTAGSPWVSSPDFSRSCSAFLHVHNRVLILTLV